MTSSVTVELSLPDQPDLMDRIITEMAKQLLSEQTESQRESLRTLARSIFEQEVTARLRVMLDEAITRSIQGTDSYGTPKGPQTTLTEVIVKRAEAELRKPRESSNGYRRNAPLIDDIIGTEIEQAWRRDLAETIQAAKDDVRAAVQTEAAKLLADAVTRAHG